MAPEADVRSWEECGRRMSFGDWSVFVFDVPARHESGLDPLFVCHGFPTSSYDWHLVLDALSEHRRVVLFDFLGFGLSDKPDVRYSIRLNADVAEAVARDCGLARVVLVSHDMGDTVGGELLARDLEGTLPFSVSSRLLTNGSIYIGMAQLTAGQLMLLNLPDARVSSELFGADPGVSFRTAIGATCAAPPDGDELQRHWLMAAHNDGHTLLPRTIRYIEDRRAEEERFTGAIEQHPSPLAVVWGRLDPIAVVAMTDRLRSGRADADVTILDDLGHYPMIEDAQQFSEAALAAFDRVAPS